MPSRIHFTIYFILSLALHALVIAAAVFLVTPGKTPLPTVTPVQIVSLPKEELRKLPPMRQPVPQPPVPERLTPPKSIPVPRKFGTGPEQEIKLPKTLPRSGLPDGAEKGKEAGKTAPEKPAGPLPFLTQQDIDALARKGMPARRPGDDSITLDTDEFKFISYNRWLKIKVESVLRYPELAAISGLQGYLYIKFDIMKDGSLGAVELLKSSGYPILDNEAIRAIKSAAPFQALPDDWSMDRYSIRAAVLFYVGEGYIR